MRRLAILALLGLCACGNVLILGDEVRSVKVTVEGTTREISLEGLGVVTVGRDESGAPLDLVLTRASVDLAVGYRIDIVTADGGRPAERPECQGLIPIDGVSAESVVVGNKLRRLFFLSGVSLCAPEDVAEFVLARKGEELCKAAAVYTNQGLRRFCSGQSCWYCDCELQGRRVFQGEGGTSCGEPWDEVACTDGIWTSAAFCLQDPENCPSWNDDYHRARCDETPK